MILVNKNNVVFKMTQEHTHKTTTMEKLEASKIEKKVLMDSAAFNAAPKDTVLMIV